MGVAEGSPRLLHLLQGGRSGEGQSEYSISIIQVNVTADDLKTIDTLVKGLAFHTSVNYQIQAPPPFVGDVHEDLLADLARIKKQKYPSEYDLHIDLSRSFKRLNDGHCVWVNYCYVCLFLHSRSFSSIHLLITLISAGL